MKISMILTASALICAIALISCSTATQQAKTARSAPGEEHFIIHYQYVEWNGQLLDGECDDWKIHLLDGDPGEHIIRIHTERADSMIVIPLNFNERIGLKEGYIRIPLKVIMGRYNTSKFIVNIMDIYSWSGVLKLIKGFELGYSDFVKISLGDFDKLSSNPYTCANYDFEINLDDPPIKSKPISWKMNYNDDPKINIEFYIE